MRPHRQEYRPLTRPRKEARSAPADQGAGAVVGEQLQQHRMGHLAVEDDHGLLASLAHDVRCAELPRQRDSLGTTSQEDDLLGSETPCGVIAAQVDGAVVIPSR